MWQNHTDLCKKLVSYCKDAKKIEDNILLPNLLIRTLNIDHFYGFCPKRPAKTPLCLSPSEEFSKKLTHYLSSVLSPRDHEVELHFLPKTAVPRHRDAKKSSSWAKTTVFWIFVYWAPRILRGDAVSSSWIVAKMQNSNNKYISILKNSPGGRAAWPCFRMFGAWPRKSWYFEEHVTKKCCPSNCLNPTI